jgi:probable rRNA maturation factor
MAHLDLHRDCPGLIVYPAFARAFRHFARSLDLDDACVVEVVLAGDTVISTVHREAHGSDEPTDCVAFPTDFPELAGGPRLIGAFYMGVEEVRRNAARLGVPLAREAAFVLAHGLLHLLGHEDYTPEDKAAMFARQEELVAGWLASEDGERLPRLLGFRGRA